jgi:hypothetical protein
MNGLRMNGLRMNGLTLDSLSFNDLPQDQSLTILDYLTSCALPDGHHIALTIGGQPFTFPLEDGGLGLAPSFEFDPLSDPMDQEFVSACLMARSNSQGKHVSISLRGPGVLAAPDAGYVYADSGFWGNLFSEQATLLSCYLRNDVLAMPQGVAIETIGRAAGYVVGDFPGFQTLGACGGATGSGPCGTLDVGWTTTAEFDDAMPTAQCSALGRAWSRPIFVTLNSIPSSNLPNGALCTSDTECAGGLCILQVCTAKPAGMSCTASAECASSMCTGGYCVVPNGTACTANTECASVHCCSGTCGSLLLSGSWCTTSCQCLSGSCTRKGRCA